MGQFGHRNMYYMTGLPGWMRLGYSPGWVGRSATGMGPAAEYLTTGQWPNSQMASQWQAMQGSTTLHSSDEIQLLKQRSQQITSQLEAIQKRIEELEGEKK
jgi:hypothetical protein